MRSSGQRAIVRRDKDSHIFQRSTHQSAGRYESHIQNPEKGHLRLQTTKTLRSKLIQPIDVYRSLLAFTACLMQSNEHTGLQWTPGE